MNRQRKLLAIFTTLIFLLSACAPLSSPEPQSNSDAPGAQTILTFQLWDESAKPAYERSFREFEKKNPDIHVEIAHISWNNYWQQLATDRTAGKMADVFLMDSTHLAEYADEGALLDIAQTIKEKNNKWQKSAVNLYTRNGALWGVPQFWETAALFYNKALLQKAEIDPANLVWLPANPDGSAAKEDTFIAAAQNLTLDANGNNAASSAFDAANIAQFAFNAQAGRKETYLNFWAQNEVPYQGADGAFTFANEKGVQATQYLVDLIHKYHVAPPIEGNNSAQDSPRDLFFQGKLALYQAGPNQLQIISENAKFEWAIAPLIAGPNGKQSVVHGVAAVGNSQTVHKEATAKLLTWLGSKEGQLPLAEAGIAFPGAIEAQEAFVNYWAKKGIDVSGFIKAASESSATAPVGVKLEAGIAAYTPILHEIFAGTRPVAEGLQAAQDAGNQAMGK